MSLVYALDYNKSKSFLKRRWGHRLSNQEIEDSYHDSLEYMLRNPTPEGIKPLTALLRVFKTMRYYEYRKKFINYNGSRDETFTFSFNPDILNQKGTEDSLNVTEIEIIQALVDTGEHFDNEFRVPHTLTERERSVISLLLEGWQQKEIAATLQCTPQAIDSYKKRAFKKIREAHENVIHS